MLRPVLETAAVGFRLTPSDATFLELLAASAALLIEGADGLTELLGADIEDRTRVAERMRDIEQQADEATHRLVARIGTAFFTPFDRGDIYALAAALDDCMDLMESAVDLVVRYRLVALPDGLAGQVSAVARMAELTAEAIPALRATRQLGDYLVEVNRLENEANRRHRALLEEILDESSTNLVGILKLKHVVDELEACANAFERVAHVVESISLKEG